MTVTLPRSLDDALAALAADPATTVLAGGTDLMVGINYGHRRPTSILSLRQVPELRGWRALDGDQLWLGSRLTYRELQEGPLAEQLPALAQAARTVGSPQIRNTGTLGGNLATASPAGDTLPVLASLRATVVVASAARGERSLPLEEFVTGPKRTARADDELIVGVTVTVPRGPQEFLKIGTRNAMVISVASCALVVDLDRRSVAATLGSVGPVPIRCTEAEAWVTDHVDWTAGVISDPSVPLEFGRRCAAAARPIDDHRSTADYRRHACGVLARRALTRCLVTALPLGNR